jgi:hypothetical protein
MTLRKHLLIAPLLTGLACAQQSSDGNLPIRVASGSEAGNFENAQTKDTPALATFRFSDDEAGKLLAKLLTPLPLRQLAPLPTTAPRERPLPSRFAQPELLPLVSSTMPVRCPMPRRADPRPSPPAERVPLELAGLLVERPERIELPVGSLARLPAPDAKLPTALPILARPSAERASLDDPTADWTAASVLTAKLPLRSTAAPFVKVDLPDPFENVEAAKVKTVVAEDPLTAIGSPPPPKP